MKLFNVTLGATCYVVAAESAEEISAHTHADKIEVIESADCYPITVAELPVVTAPVAALATENGGASHGEQEPQAPLN